MAIIDSYNRKRGVTYVYESISYWDKELKQPRSRRRLLGRRDLDTGDLVPTRKRKKTPSFTSAAVDSATDYATLYRRSQEAIRKKDEQIQQLRHDLANTGRLLKRQEKIIAQAMAVLQSLQSLSPEKDAIHG